MANPQKENGTTDIANEIIEVLYRVPLQNYELKVILFVLRWTYGFHEKERFLKPCFIAQGTGIKRPNISRTLKQLEAKNMITRTGNMVGFQKDYDKWELSPQITISTDNKLSPQIQEVISTDTGSVSLQIHKETKKEETKKEDIYKTSFEKFWGVYPKKKSKGTAYKSWLKLKPDQKLVDKIIQAVLVQKKSKDWLKEDGQFIPYPATWLNGMRWEDEVENNEPKKSKIIPYWEQ